MNGKLIFLGTGGSLGVPVVGCDCAICQSHDLKNKRLRSSVLLKVDGKVVLLDCGPDFREQALRYKISKLDGVILTHSHYDHACGLDELRIYPIRSRTPLPLLLSSETLLDVRNSSGYLFQENKVDLLKTKFAVQVLDGKRGVANFLGLNIQFMTFEQAGMQVNGFRFGSLAYISDIKQYDETIFDDLKGVDTLIISALRFTPSPLHLSIDEAVAFIRRTGAKQAWLVHLSHEVEHQHGNAYLPENVRLAYDGLEISFE